jgi:TRAP transporter TAXI family solute receptor
MAFLLTLGPIALGAASAQTAYKGSTKAPVFSHQAAREKANENLLMLLGGSLGGPYLQLAQDIATAVNDKDNMRVLPIAGDGAVGNVRDILLLRGVDLGITSVQVLNAIKASGEFGPNLERRIAYIAQLSVDTFHVLARPEIGSLQDLNGKKVNVLQKGSGTSVFGPKILKPLGVEVVEVYATHNDGVQMMRAGEIDGALCVCPIPVPAYTTVKPDMGFKLLEVPYIPQFEESYLPASVTGEQYPALIAAGSKVQTIGTSTVLISFNWPPGSERYRKIEKFVQAFFAGMDKLRQSPRHPVWKDVNIGASIRGWQRFPAAQQWLDHQAAQAAAKAPLSPGLDLTQARAQAAKAAPGNAGEQERLFREFLEWSRNRPRR